jgi:HK97 family phage prohead protease
MIIRTKGGEFCEANSSVLLDFFGVKITAAGVHRVSGDVELFAGVPFIKEQAPTELAIANSNEQSQEGVAWTLSTFDLDRFGERVDPNGWDFSQYIKNPVVEWAHRYDIPAIGRIEGLAVDDNGLHGSVVFNSKEYDAFGWGIGERVKAGVIRAGSVGFRVIEIEIPSKEDSKDGTSLIFRKQELLEFSICNVPANPYALSKSNEHLANSKEKGTNAIPFWNCLINNFEG